MMNEHLMRVVIENAVFFAFSSDDAVDPDQAVAQLEMMAAELQAMTKDDISKFRAFVSNVAEAEEAGGGNGERISLLRSLGDNFGLARSE